MSASLLAPPSAAGQSQPAPSAPAASGAELSPPPAWDGISLAPLRALAYRALLAALDQIAEAKTLILDPSLAGPLGLVADVPTLRQHGVERMFWLEEPREDESHLKDERGVVVRGVNAPTRAVVYVARPGGRWIRTIAGHILHDRRTSTSSSLAHTYHALFSPRRTELSLHLLSTLTPPGEAPLLSSLTLYDLSLEFVPLDEDLLSLEDGRAWRRIFCDGDMGAVYESAMALMTMQHVWGMFPRITGKGDLAKQLASLLGRLRREHLASDPTNPALTTPSSVIDSLIIIERSADLVTPLCSQLTYAGLVDELLGIQSAHVEVDASLLANTSNAGPGTPSGSGTPLQMTTPVKKKKHRLDAASDSIFASVRDENFAVVGEKLHLAAKRLTEGYDARHAAKTVQQIRAFVGKLGNLQNEHSLLRLHTSLTEQIMGVTTSETFNRALEIQQNIVAGLDLPAQQTAIEELINAEAPLLVVLRLLCLLSVVGGGIKPKNLEYVKREIVQTYGYEHLGLLLSLADVGLLVRATPSSSRSSIGFQAVRQPLKLINDDVDERNPTDVSYVYSGYAPLSVRLVQAVAQKEALLDAPQHANPSASGAPADRSKAPLPKAHPIVGWRGFTEVVNSLPGATFDEIQRPLGTAPGRGVEGANGAATAAGASASSTAAPTTTTVVFFLGGVTQTEIAALRFMSRQTRNRRFVIASTNTLNGDSMIRSLGEGSGGGGSAAAMLRSSDGLAGVAGVGVGVGSGAGAGGAP